MADPHGVKVFTQSAPVPTSVAQRKVLAIANVGVTGHGLRDHTATVSLRGLDHFFGASATCDQDPRHGIYAGTYASERLFVPQYRHGIEGCRASCGYESGNYRGSQEQSGNAEHQGWADPVYAVELVPHHLRSEKADEQAR
jgi:hypothetical protein